MEKELSDKACYLDMANGYHGLPYRQQFVRAPLSQHPPKENRATGKFEASEAMNVSMGR
jgi:hypothetical protein